MRSPKKPLEVVVYQDVLCAWCYVAEGRLARVREELGDAVSWRYRPYALRVKDAALTEKERSEWEREVLAAREEPDGKAISSSLWTGADLPRSSIPALIALEAARLQGKDAHRAMANALQRAAIEGGVNVTRDDVMMEVAGQVGLNMGRFAAALSSAETKRLVLDEHKQAEGRGVKGVPTLVIGGRWMLSGLRDLDEYREQLAECLSKTERQRDPSSAVH